jgi:hypothetical protein
VSDSEPTDSRGRPLYGRAREVAQAADQRRRAEAEALATYQAVARALVKLMARGALSGPDALRNLVGPGDALRILRAAGMDAEPVAAGWQADQLPSGPAEHKSSPWASSPDHDPRVAHALVQGASDGELARIRVAVAQEYAQAAAGKAARQQSRVMWHSRHGAVVDGGTAPLGVSLGPDGAPVQVSRVNESVPPLGSEK